MSKFYQTYLELTLTIEESINQGRVTAALIILYSAIDGISFLTTDTHQPGKKVFKDWVRKWMLERYPLQCNEVDLYSARCGLLHQQISESTLTEKNEAKEVYYVWGRARLDILEEAIESSGKKERAVAVKVEDLFNSFRSGLHDCLAEVEKDEHWKQSFDVKAVKLFTQVHHLAYE